MNTRKLKDGTTVSELDESIVLTVKTKCPEKWILFDKETGEVYTGYTTTGKNSWKKLDTSIENIINHARR
jgi:hypothetical protein